MSVNAWKSLRKKLKAAEDHFKVPGQLGTYGIYVTQEELEQIRLPVIYKPIGPMGKKKRA